MAKRSLLSGWPSHIANINPLFLSSIFFNKERDKAKFLSYKCVICRALDKLGLSYISEGFNYCVNPKLLLYVACLLVMVETFKNVGTLVKL